MSQKSEIFIVCFKSENAIKYAALDSRDSLVKSENPMSFKHYFSHEQATEIVKALRKKGLDEGVTVRAKSLAQSLRDYAWSLIQQSREVETTGTETLEKVLKRYEVKEKTSKVEDQPAEPETTESE